MINNSNIEKYNSGKILTNMTCSTRKEYIGIHYIVYTCKSIEYPIFKSSLLKCLYLNKFCIYEYKFVLCYLL